MALCNSNWHAPCSAKKPPHGHALAVMVSEILLMLLIALSFASVGWATIYLASKIGHGRCNCAPPLAMSNMAKLPELVGRPSYSRAIGWAALIPSLS